MPEAAQSMMLFEAGAPSAGRSALPRRGGEQASRADSGFSDYMDTSGDRLSARAGADDNRAEATAPAATRDAAPGDTVREAVSDSAETAESPHETGAQAETGAGARHSGIARESDTGNAERNAAAASVPADGALPGETGLDAAAEDVAGATIRNATAADDTADAQDAAASGLAGAAGAAGATIRNATGGTVDARAGTTPAAAPMPTPGAESAAAAAPAAAPMLTPGAESAAAAAPAAGIAASRPGTGFDPSGQAPGEGGDQAAGGGAGDDDALITGRRARPAAAAGDAPDLFARLAGDAIGERSGSGTALHQATSDPPAIASPSETAQSAVRAALQADGRVALPMRAIAVHIAHHLANGQREFQIRLDPPELGRVEVRVEIARDGRLTAHLTADRPDTLDALMRDARALERALNAAGLDLEDDALSFELRQHDAGDGSGPGREGRENAAGKDASGEEDQPAPARTLSLNALDIRV